MTQLNLIKHLTSNLNFITKNKNIMKTMTCKELGGACDKEFHANTFENFAKVGKVH